MAGLKSNIAGWGISKQNSKGTAITTPAFQAAFTDGNVEPNEEFARLEETDSTRAQGDAYKKQGGASADPAAYLRDNYAGRLLEAALGTRVTTGTTNFTHTYTPSNTLAYYTLYRSLSDTLHEQLTDAVCSQLEVNIEAGSPGIISTEWMARSIERLTTNPFLAGPVTIEDDAPYNWNDAAVQLAGANTPLLSAFNLTINNNCSYQQTDDYKPYDVHYGRREITVGFDMIFESLTHYQAFHYPVGGLTQSDALYTTDLEVIITHSGTNEIKFTLPRVTIEEFPIAPDQSGDPIVVAVRGSTARGVSADLTAVVKNQRTS